MMNSALQGEGGDHILGDQSPLDDPNVSLQKTLCGRISLENLAHPIYQHHGGAADFECIQCSLRGGGAHRASKRCTCRETVRQLSKLPLFCFGEWTLLDRALQR